MPLRRRRGEQEERGDVPEGASRDFDPSRRRVLGAAAALAVGGAGAYAAAKTGWLGRLVGGGSPAVTRADHLPAGLYAATTAGGQAIQLPVLDSDPGGVTAGAIWYRGDLGSPRYMDGQHGKVQDLELKRPYLVVGGSDPGLSDFGSFASPTGSNGWWEAFASLPRSSGRAHGYMIIREGNFPLTGVSPGNIPIDIGDVIIQGSGAATVVTGIANGVTFKPPSGNGLMKDMMYVGS